MKKIIVASRFLLLLPIALTAILFSFSKFPGGEGFEVFLNNQVILQKFNTEMKNRNMVELAKASPNDELRIKYHHCGNTGKNRVFRLKNEKNQVVKEWQFNDGGSVAATMTCKVKDLGQSSTGNSFQLYFYSSELPDGRLLTGIHTPANQVAIK